MHIYQSMEDLLYPDNPKRESRVHQLSDDISTEVDRLKNYARIIKSLLKALDEKIRSMYSNIQVNIPTSSIKQVNYHGWVVSAVETIEPFIIYPLAAGALELAATSWLLSEGMIGQAALVELVGLPVWMGLGVAAGAIIIVVGIELVIAGIAGAEKRDKLRDAIHSAIQPRINLKKASLINGSLKNKLKAVKDSCDMMILLGYTKEQLDRVQKDISDKFKQDVALITDQTAINYLADLDQQRGSWTNEDH